MHRIWGLAMLEVLLMLAMLMIIGVMIYRHWQSLEADKEWRSRNQMIETIMTEATQYQRHHGDHSGFNVVALCQQQQLPAALCGHFKRKVMTIHQHHNQIILLLFDLPSRVCRMYQKKWRAYDPHCERQHHNQLTKLSLVVK